MADKELFVVLPDAIQCLRVAVFAILDVADKEVRANGVDDLLSGHCVPAMRLHRGRGRIGDRKKARSRSMPISEALPQARVYRMGERALRGASAAWIHTRPRSLAVSRRRGNVWKVSEMASFSSSLKRLLSVVDYMGLFGVSVVFRLRGTRRASQGRMAKAAGKLKTKRWLFPKLAGQRPQREMGHPRMSFASRGLALPGPCPRDSTGR